MAIILDNDELSSTLMTLLHCLSLSFCNKKTILLVIENEIILQEKHLSVFTLLLRFYLVLFAFNLLIYYLYINIDLCPLLFILNISLFNLLQFPALHLPHESLHNALIFQLIFTSSHCTHVSGLSGCSSYVTVWPI